MPRPTEADLDHRAPLTHGRKPADASARKALPMQTREAPLSSFNDETRTAEIVWTTGARVLRYDWWNGRAYHEELSLDPKHVRMGRLEGGSAPLLDSHGGWSLRGVLGVVEGASLKAKEGRATVRFSKRADVEQIVQDVRDGIVRNVSVGYAVHKFERIAPKNEGDPWTYRAVDWEPMELSLVPIGADPKAGVRSQGGLDLNVRTFECEFIDRQNPMDEDTQTTTASARSTPAGAGDADMQRLVRLANLPPAFGDALIREGVTVEQAGRRILSELAHRSEQHEPRPSTWQAAMFTDQASPEARRSLMAEALASRAGVAPSDAARPFARMRLRDMVRELLELRGQRTSYLSPGELIERSITTTDLPNLLTSTGNRVLAAAFTASAPAIKRIARSTTLPDFRSKYHVKFSAAPSLEKVNEGGEYKYSAIDEGAESYGLDKYGRIIALTFEAMVNDDLGAFERLTRAFGESAAQREGQQLVDLLTSASGAGPTMGDGTALFHANHGNLAGSGTAISDTSIGLAMLALRKQTGLDGKTIIDVTPRYLLVPAALEAIANKYTSTAYVPAKQSDINPFAGRLEVLVEPRLDAKSATAWYLATDPDTMPALEYAYLEGEPGPQMFQHEGFVVDGVQFKCRLAFGCGAVEHRSIYRNPGA